MNYRHQFILIPSIAAVVLYAVTSCNFDPWPEPDPNSNESKDDESGADADGDSDEDANEDADDDGSEVDAGTDDDSEADIDLPDNEYIFCSAPGPDGRVTVVGLPKAADHGDSVVVRGEQDQIETLELSEDGSFAGRIQAEENELLSFSIVSGETESDSVQIPVGIAENGFVEDGIIGSGDIDSPDREGYISIHGQGSRLESELLAIVGNLDHPNGRSAHITCVSICQFNLIMPGEIGDEIDVFLVPSGEHSGVTDSQNLIIPEP
ncbi:MAG: hypothetical protein GY847_16365 [Proteobacteria bacterium]|nr:hypothetical protein [Pseudomonadota bacterium]